MDILAGEVSDMFIKLIYVRKMTLGNIFQLFLMKHTVSDHTTHREMSKVTTSIIGLL